MAISLRNLIYTKDFPNEIKYKLLHIVDSSTWLEDLIDLMKELSEDKEECNAPADCGDCQGGHLEHECAYMSLYSDHKITVEELDDMKVEKEDFEKAIVDLKTDIGKMVVRIKYPDKDPGDIEAEALNIAEYGDPLRELDEAMGTYREELDKGIKKMLKNVKMDIYGNSNPEAFNRYTSIKRYIDPLNELENLIPEYLLIQKRKLMERLRSNSGLTVGNIELPHKVDI